MRHERFNEDKIYETADLVDLQIQQSQLSAPFRSAAAVPDVPAALGKLIVASYVALLATFAVTMSHSREAAFAMAICGVFLTMYLLVPRVFLGVEPEQAKRPSFDSFLRDGFQTYTGPCSGKDAVIQMLLIPVVLTLCGLAMGIVALVTL